MRQLDLNIVVCPGCGLELESDTPELDQNYHASVACRAVFDRLTAFSLTVQDIDFVHQLAVDSYAAQHSGPPVKPISTAFALIGLYLTFERGFNGKKVQKAHMMLGRTHRPWPLFNPPPGKALQTVFDVVQGLTRENYRARLKTWGQAVWLFWSPEHENIRKLADTYLKM